MSAFGIVGLDTRGSFFLSRYERVLKTDERASNNWQRLALLEASSSTRRSTELNVSRRAAITVSISRRLHDANRILTFFRGGLLSVGVLRSFKENS